MDRSSGEIVSILVAESRFKAIWDILNDLELASEEEVYVIDRAGLVVAHRHPAIVLRGTTIELPEVDGRAQGLSGTDVIVARHKLQLGNQELIVVAEQSVSNALGLANKNLGIMVSVVFSALALAFILTVYATRRIVRPIEALATSAGAISGGDFSQQVEVSSRDEIGELATAFNKMAEDLARTTTSIDNLNKEITERKRMEQALRESEEKFRVFMETASDLMSMTDKDGKYTYVNDSMARTLGYSKEELIGMHVTQLLSKESLEKDFKPNWGKFLTNGEISIETTMLTKEGKEIYCEIKAVAVYDSDGNVVGGKAVHRDITERKQAEEALRESEEQYRSLVNNIMLGVFRSTPGRTGRFLEVNPAMEEITGYSREELLKMNVSDLYVHPEERVAVLEKIASTTGKTTRELSFRKKDGTEITISDTKVPVRDSAGKILYFDGILEPGFPISNRGYRQVSMVK